MSFGLTYPQLKKLNPCEDQLEVVRKALGGARKWNGNLVTAQMARDAGVSFDNILWAASAIARGDEEVRRRLRHFAADCAARVLHLFEKERPDDKRVRQSIQAARDYAGGKIEAAAGAAAGAAAHAAAGAAAQDAAWSAAWSAAGAAAGAAWVTAQDAVWAARRAVSWEGEKEWQFDRLIAWLSEEEPEPLPLPELMEAAQ